MTTHIRYSLFPDVMPDAHPVDQMRNLGITYEHATPQSMGDQWWFWNCKNIPDPLPPYLSPLNISPMEAIGYGLSESKAKELNHADTP